jgi:Ca2+-binding EF-hand superfamily protein
MSFKAVDGDGSGNISKKELELLFRNLEMTVTDFQLDYLIKEIDKDCSGEIDSDEFCIMMWQLSIGTLTLPADKNSIQTPFQVLCHTHTLLFL